MDEKDRDRLLRIKTVGTREWLKDSVHYNRYEATPYFALDELFDEYELNKADGIVDFGCGKGRLTFYVHNRFNIAVTGVEGSGQLYQEAHENQMSYIEKVKKPAASIRFEHCLAEEYKIEPADNRFYFFNPFSVKIFMKVVNNILLSVERQERSVDLILYYPSDEYIQFLETSTSFELFDEVKVPGVYARDNDDRFLIFRLE